MYEPGTAEGDTPTTRRWRTMFHVVYWNKFDGVWVRIPAWSGDLAVRIPWEQIAPELHDTITYHIQERFHGLACIGCDSYKDLNAYINEN